MDLFSLQLLMGHADIQVLRRYLKQANQDLLEIHRRVSPVDNLKKKNLFNPYYNNQPLKQ